MDKKDTLRFRIENMKTENARCYLKGCKPTFSLPRKMAPNLFLRLTESTEPLKASSLDVHKSCPIYLEWTNCCGRDAIFLFQSIIYGVRLSSDCAIRIIAYDFTNSSLIKQKISSDLPAGFLWGHYSEKLSENSVEYTISYFQALKKYSMADQFNRISNAIRLHRTAMETGNCDLALLGFISSLESLFSVSPQELSFRLSLIVAKFLGKNIAGQKKLYKEVKNLYKIRSAISHGDKIYKSEESTAIALVEHWTPLAEELNRKCLRLIFERGLKKIFESNELVEKFLFELLFATNIKNAISKTRKQ